jgi:lauroyl/myristoyl acyltransferase
MGWGITYPSMPASFWLLSALLYRYWTMRYVRPEWSRIHRAAHLGGALFKFARYRVETFLFLIFGYMPYRVKWFGKDELDLAIAHGGAVLMTVHSGPYPLAGRFFRDAYPETPLVAPFFWRSKLSSFTLFRRLFKRLDITVVALGGAMKEIGPALEHGGVVLTCMDAALPVKRTQPVRMFDRQGVRLTTGPLWLSRKYRISVIPMYVREEDGFLEMHLLPALSVADLPDDRAMAIIGSTVERMIEATVDQWQAMDEFFFYTDPIEAR